MTVVVGFVGDNCAVMASDSQLTTGGMKTTADKIWPAPKGIVLGCASNHWAVKQHLEQGIQGYLDGLPADPLTRAESKAHLEGIVQATLTLLYGSAATTTTVPTHLTTLLLGVGHDAASGYWLLEIGPNGLALEHDARGFAAIGSGFDAAQIGALLLDHYEPRQRPIHHLKLVAHRMVSVCVAGLSQAVGGPIQLWSSENGDPFVKASDDELTELEEAVKVWRGVEGESLAQSLGEAVAEDVQLPADLDETVADALTSVAEVDAEVGEADGEQEASSPA